jgi:hypothetical protein
MAEIIRFGSDFSHSDYVVPMAKIELYDQRGSQLRSTLYIRMGGTFSTSIRAAYDDAQGIFGTPFTTDQNVISKIGSAGVGFVNALQAQLTRAYYGARGTIASAGLSGRQQIEFLSRVFLSNFQQVVYRGPSFRIFTLPFVMKPTSLTEAKNMRKIISSLKIASVPKVGTGFALTEITNEALSSVFGRTVNFDQRIAELQNDLRNTTLTEEQREVTQAELNELESVIEASDSKLFSEDSPLTFVYPDVCAFELVLVKGSAAGGGGEPSTITTVFKSKKCVIESVVADYGSSNKMTFFDSSSNEYYPTEVSLTLNLKELEFQTNKTILEYSKNPNYTIL